MDIEVPIIDAHAHMAADSPAAQALLSQLGVRVLNISLGLDTRGEWRARSDFGAHAFQALARANPRNFAWCTSFDLPSGADVHYAERVISELERDFASGAVACKVWKNIGMEVRDRSGGFLLVDHPLLTPVFAHLERRGCPVIMHVGEPKACWEPLDQESPHFAYYSEHPEWHMFGKPEVPSWSELLDARDRVLARHPQMRVVGAHLGSIEHDVVELARRLARFPNFAVDTGGRLLDLALQDPARVRALFEQYPTRILFGSDICLPRAVSEMPSDEADRSLTEIAGVYQRELAFYCSTERVHIGERDFAGLGLSSILQHRLLHDNARACFG